MVDLVPNVVRELGPLVGESTCDVSPGSGRAPPSYCTRCGFTFAPVTSELVSTCASRPIGVLPSAFAASAA